MDASPPQASPYPPIDALDWRGDRTPWRCPARRADLIVTPLDDEAIVHDPRTGQTLRLNPTAWRVWQACLPGATTDDLRHVLLEAYEVDAATAGDDIEQLLACWVRHGLMAA